MRVAGPFFKHLRIPRRLRCHAHAGSGPGAGADGGRGHVCLALIFSETRFLGTVWSSSTFTRVPRSPDVDARPALRVGFVLADDFADYRGRVAAAEQQVAHEMCQRVAFGPFEIGVGPDTCGVS